MSRVLFVSHDASRTGAPKALIPILDVVEGELERFVVVKHAGPLLSDFETRCEQLLLEPGRGILRFIRSGGAPLKAASKDGPSRLLGMGLRMLVSAETRAAGRVLDSLKPNLVYINTLAAAEFVNPAMLRRIPTILHVHEIGDRADELLARYGVNLRAANLQVVACSKATARHIDIPDAAVIPNIVDPTRLRALAQRGHDAVEDEGSIVATVGSVGWWKGPDLFLAVARLVVEAEPTARFIWLGGGPELQQAKNDSLPSVTFTGEVDNPYATVARALVLVVSSRVESFGLAAAEAMALGVPVAGFDVGGLSEVLADSGVLVEAGNVEALAAAIVSLLRDPERRKRLASLGEDRVQRYFVRDAVAPLIKEVIERALKP